MRHIFAGVAISVVLQASLSAQALDRNAILQALPFAAITNAVDAISWAKKHHDVELLRACFNSPHSDIHGQAVMALDSFDVPDRKSTLATVLRKESLWLTPADFSVDGGEWLSGRMLVEDNVQVMVKDLLGSSGTPLDFHTQSGRNAVAAKLEVQ